MLVGIKSCALKAHIKALCATLAAFGFVFKSLYSVKPVVDIVVSINHANAVFFGKPDIFIFTNFVFFNWMNIRIVKKYIVLNACSKHRFHDFARAGRTARVQQHFGPAFG